jgi:long-subunit acyl-CoA synthetase (AMP-forming)
LITYLQDIKPTFFWSVPRVWEKIEEKMKAIAASNGWLKSKIGIKLIFYKINNINKIKKKLNLQKVEE